MTESDLISILTAEKFLKGKNLDNLLREVEAVSHQTGHLRDCLSACIYRTLQQAIATLQLVDYPAHSIDAHLIDYGYEQQQLKLEQEQQFNIALCFYHIAQLQVYYLFENYPAALELALTTKDLIEQCSNELAIAEYYFYYSLTLVAVYPTATEEKKASYWTILVEYLNQFKHWSNEGAESADHKYLLIQAEVTRLLGDILTAMEYYDQAIASSQESGYLQNQALANELAAKFYWHQGRHKIAKAYMTDAHGVYQQWRAIAKVNDLEQKYSQLIDHLKISTDTSHLYQDLEQSLQAQIELTEAYSRFVPKEFLQLLGKKSVVDVELGDQVQLEMSVLFADICDFTTLSEQMTPEENFKFINSYFGHMESVIAENGGFIDKYIGDSIMALFNGEVNDAVDAAIAMIHNLSEYNQHRVELSQSPIQIGVGINTGSLMLGTVGGANRMDSTVISDAVNLSARIEKLTRDYGVKLLITQQTLTRLHNPEQYSIRMIDQVKVKGKSELVTVYEVFDADPPDVQFGKRLTAQPLTEALSLFNARRYREATRLLETCLDQNPQDKVARIYLERCLKSGLHLMQEL